MSNRVDSGNLTAQTSSATSSAVPVAPVDREFCEHLFMAWQGTIDQMSHAVARRYNLTREEAEDFASEVRLRLIANDYAILRQFGGRSRIARYLNVVIQRQMLDRNNAKWGKWRPSQASKRMGPVAVTLERLTMRDGLPFEEACVSLEVRTGVRIDRREYAALHDSWMAPPKRRMVPLDAVSDMAAPSKTPYEALAETEVGGIAREVAALLRRLVRQLPAADRRVLALKFKRGQTSAKSARALDVNPKIHYRRMERLFRNLRGQLESAGFSRESVLSGIGCTLAGHALSETPIPNTRTGW
jgi:RNA polymerase sigma factor (sigma-70 family)